MNKLVDRLHSISQGYLGRRTRVQGAVLQSVMEGVPEKVTSEQRPEGYGSGSRRYFWEEHLLFRERQMRKAHRAAWRSAGPVCAAEAKQARVRGVKDGFRARKEMTQGLAVLG